jgi:transcriptional regulator with XRE-family HTH domain
MSTQMTQSLLKPTTTLLTPAQCAGARAMLNLSRKELAALSGVAERTIVDFERGARAPFPRTLADLVRTLETAGVLLIPADELGPGVRLRHPEQSSS